MKNTIPELPSENIKITRNDITFETIFTTVSKRSALLGGTSFPTLEFSEKDFDSMVLFLGKDYILNTVNADVRRFSWSVFSDSITYSGEGDNKSVTGFDYDGYVTQLEQLAESRATTDSLDSEIDNLTTEIQDIIGNDKFSVNDDGSNAEEVAEFIASAKAISERITELKTKRAIITRRYEIAAQKRAAKLAEKALAEKTSINKPKA